MELSSPAGELFTSSAAASSRPSAPLGRGAQWPLLSTAGQFLTDPISKEPGALAKMTIRFSGLPADLDLKE
eukprot:95811-Lingulodinium_polyedra.AAC.1